MSTIETLPRHIIYGKDNYELRMHITAWDKICLCYHSYKAEKMVIFSQVIEPESHQPYISNPKPEDIIDVCDFDNAVCVLINRLMDAIKTNLIKI